MDQQRLAVKRLTEHLLTDARGLPVALLLEVLMPVQRMRALARRLDVAPKGGFRVDKAPARLLAPLLAEQRDPAALETVLEELAAAVRGADPAPALPASGPPAPAEIAAAAGGAQAMLQLREQELERLRSELERSRQVGLRAQEREAELRQALERRDEEVLRLRTDLDRHRSAPANDLGARGDSERDQLRRVRELEQEIAGHVAADEALRRQLAVDRTRVRALEEELVELERLVPKERRRRKAPEPPPPPARRFLLPYLTPSFYRSLDGKDRRAIERALQAILLFCTEGHAYPGLDVKQLGGQEIWSLRASLGLRVYFRQRDDGDVEIIELADREEQNTTLRRLKER